ncbi:MAG: DedA family protein [Chloroflexota bacterium]
MISTGFLSVVNSLMLAAQSGSGGLFDMTEILKTFGYIGIITIIFAESGLLIGFFLPGDSLLFTAGILASQGFFDISLLAISCFIAAVTGDSVGYWFGAKVGPHIFTKEDSLFFQKKNITRAQHFYEKYGAKTILLARFVPVVRTFAPIVAGIGMMKYRTFLSYNLIGGFLWAVGVSVAGYFLGASIPDIDKYLLPIIALIILASVTPPAWHILKEPENREALRRSLKNLTNRKPKTIAPLADEIPVKAAESPKK